LLIAVGKGFFWRKVFEIGNKKYLTSVYQDSIIMTGEVISLAQADRTTSWRGGRASLNRMRLTRSDSANLVEQRWLSRIRSAGTEGPPWGSNKDDTGLKSSWRHGKQVTPVDERQCIAK
jgi:hypothetical protein